MGRIVKERPPRTTWRGLGIPVTNFHGEHWESKYTLDLIWSSIMLIIATPLGTRIMLPEFGSLIPTLVFEPNDAALDALARRYIIDAVARWEPRVDIIDVFVQVNDNEFRIGMKFIVRGMAGTYEGTFLIYRNQSFKLAEQFYMET